MTLYDRHGNAKFIMEDREFQDFLDGYYQEVLISCKHCGHALIPKSASLWYCPTCDEMNHVGNQIEIRKV